MRNGHSWRCADCGKRLDRNMLILRVHLRLEKVCKMDEKQVGDVTEYESIRVPPLAYR